jgi:hypothetical protein
VSAGIIPAAGLPLQNCRQRKHQMILDRLIELQSVLASFLTFLLGLLIGHRFGLQRDKRKEFNEAARPIRDFLIEEVSKPNAYRKFPSRSELDAFAQCLPGRRRRAFQTSWRSLLEAWEQVETDAWGGREVKDPEPIRRAAEQCLRYTKRK